MPARKKATPVPARKPAGQSRAKPARQPRPAQAAAVADDNENPRSSQTQVVLPAEDDPVRCGGYVLTDNGWVLEGGPVPGDDGGGDDAADEQE